VGAGVCLGRLLHSSGRFQPNGKCFPFFPSYPDASGAPRCDSAFVQGCQGQRPPRPSSTFSLVIMWSFCECLGALFFSIIASHRVPPMLLFMSVFVIWFVTSTVIAQAVHSFNGPSKNGSSEVPPLLHPSSTVGLARFAALPHAPFFFFIRARLSASIGPEHPLRPVRLPSCGFSLYTLRNGTDY